MNFRISGSILVASAMTLLASLTGCVIIDKTDDTDTGSGAASVSSTAGDGTTGPTSGPSTSGTSDTGVLTGGATITTEVPTSTDASATGEATTGEATTGDATTGDATTGDATTGANPELQAACEAACMVFLECMPGTYPDLETCAATCIAGASGGAKCEIVATEFNLCVGGFTCEQLNMALMNQEFGACTEAFDAYVASCSP